MKCIVHAPAVHEYLLDETEFAPLVNLTNDIEARKEWMESLTMSKMSGYRTSTSFHITRNKGLSPQIAQYDNLVYTAFNTALAEYQKSFDIKVQQDEGYELLRYEGGQHYKKHVDAGGEQFGRIVSGLFYLNSNFVGGELELLHFNVKIKPSTPSIILFPSNYVYEHIAHPVTEGAKYAIVTFFHPLDELLERNKMLSQSRPAISLYGATNI